MYIKLFGIIQLEFLLIFSNKAVLANTIARQCICRKEVIRRNKKI